MLKFLGDRDTHSPQNTSPNHGDVEGSPEEQPLQPEIQLEQEVEQEGDLVELNRDPTCSEGVIKVKIARISAIGEKLLSPAIYVRDLPWYSLQDWFNFMHN